MSMMLNPPMPPKPPMPSALLPGSEVIRVRSWSCDLCGDGWIILGSENQTAVAVLIHHHSVWFHQGEPVPGRYRNHLCVIRPPMPTDPTDPLPLTDKEMPI